MGEEKVCKTKYLITWQLVVSLEYVRMCLTLQFLPYLLSLSQFLFCNRKRLERLAF
jgi:hypothetical protein